MRPALFTLARHGALNRHLGVTPAYRGSDCPLWALALGDAGALGFTIHFVSEQVDRGDVIVQQRVPLQSGESMSAYLARLQRTGSESLVRVLDALVAGEPVPRAPQRAGGHHFPPATLSALIRARRNHDRLARPRTGVVPPPPAPERREASLTR